MAEQIQPSPDHIPERRPFHKVQWNGSVAEIYDATPMLETPVNEVNVYDRSDFQTPIERVQVSIQQVDLDGETGTALTAKIMLDRTRDDYMKAPGLLAPFRRDSQGNCGFIPHNSKDQDLVIEPTVFGNVHKVSHVGGGKLLVWVDSDKKIVTVSNSLALSSLSSTNGQGERKNTVEVIPPVDGTVDSKAMLDAFFKSFMRTVDFTAGLTGYNPSTARLKRSYAIGKEIKDARPVKSAPNIGRSAVAGPPPSSKSNEKDASRTTGRRSSLTEDLPEVEIVESKLSLDDVGGLEQVKKTLSDIATSFQHPEVMEKWGATRPQGVLMYGEPGTGKTMLAQALANEIGAEMWALQSTDIYEKWLGNSESRIKDIFDRARQHEGRLVLFFDEFDSIVGITESPSSGGDNARNAVAGIFKQEMNTLAKDNPDVLIVAATNNLDRIDPALVRSGRFDHKVYIPMPDQEARQQIIAGIAAKSMLQQETADFKVFGDDLDTTKLANETDGMSGADISELFRRLGLSRAMQEARTGQQQPAISQDEIEQEIRRFRTTG